MERKFKIGDKVRTATGESGVICDSLTADQATEHMHGMQLEGVDDEFNNEPWYEVDFYQDGTNEGKSPWAEPELRKLTK